MEIVFLQVQGMCTTTVRVWYSLSPVYVPPHLQNPSQVGVSLQVFYNLGQLSPTLQSILGGYRDAIQHDIQNALDPATLMQATDC